MDNTFEKTPIYEGAEPYIFISYSHKNNQQATDIIELLYENGYRVWYDNGLIPGDQYMDVIASHIKDCTVFMCLLSKDYTKSKICINEATYALSILHKEAVPVILQQQKTVMDSLTDGLHMALSVIQWYEYLPITSKDSFLEKIRLSDIIKECQRVEAFSEEELFEIGMIRYHAEEYGPAEHFLLLAAQKNNIKAAGILGLMYKDGIGIKPDSEQARKWLQIPAENGNREAQTRLADVLFLQFPNQEREAARWYRKAAEQGDQEAQYKLGSFYFYGRAVVRNLQEALKWFRMAADQQNAGAQYMLGYMYEGGRGVMKNMDEAIRWYSKAAEQGYEDAVTALERLE